MKNPFKGSLKLPIDLRQLSLCAFLLGLTFSSVPLSAAELHARIRGIKKTKGSLRAALFDKKQSLHFPKNVQFALLRVNQRALKKEATIVFKNPPAGSYAIAVFHDKNNNGKLDKNIFGMPKEGYGFSGPAAQSRRRAAKFEEAEISLSPNQVKTIEIRLR